MPTEVDYNAKDGLQIGSEVFPYAYTNAHTIGYEVVIMVIVQTGSELTLNTHLSTYSSYCKEAGPELFFNAYLSCY